MSYHFTPNMMAWIKKSDSKCWQGSGKIGNLIHFGSRNGKCSSYFGKWSGNSSNGQTQSYSMTQQLHLGTYSREVKTMSHRHLHTTFRAAFFKIAKRWRWSQTLINGWMSFFKVAYPHNGIVFVHKKWNTNDILQHRWTLKTLC